jgi:hypothetical protein
MNRSSCFAALIGMLAGCGGRTETPAPIVENAIAASVSPDQSLLAYYAQPSHVSGTRCGSASARSTTSAPV